MRTLMYLLLAICASSAASARKAEANETPDLYVDRFLVHIYLPWQYPPKDIDTNSRYARASILFFDANGEFVEHHAIIITSRNSNSTLFISPGDGHDVAVGVWSHAGPNVVVTRKHVYRFVRFVGDIDPFCQPATETYKIVSKGLKNGEGIFFNPTDKLDTSSWAPYVALAKSSELSTSCEAAN